MPDFSSQYQNPYDYLRQKAKEESSQQKSEQDEALKRRFAAQGNLNSGAYLKTAQMASEQADKQAQDAQNQIGFQEAQEKSQREFQTGERLGTQAFQHQLTQEDQAFKSKYADLDNAFREKEFGLNQQATNLNAAIALKNAGFAPGDAAGINASLKKLGINFNFGSYSGSGQPGAPRPGQPGQPPEGYDDSWQEPTTGFQAAPGNVPAALQAGFDLLSPEQQNIFYRELNTGGWNGALNDANLIKQAKSPGFSNPEIKRYLQNKYGGSW